MKKFHLTVLCAILGAAVAMAIPAIEPLLCGFNPDPSICRAGEDYYLVTSSFSLFPGLPVYHSRNLTDWEVIGHAWTSLMGQPVPSDDDGIWAPTIRFHDGTFYISVTFRGKDGQANYILSAKNPAGPWSEPVKVDAKEGIDGSLFFDGAKAYYQSNARPKKIEWGRQCVIWAQEIDLATLRLLGERHVLTSGSGEKPVFAEGPHIYKIDGKYRLLMAQGGTGFDHAASLHVAENVFGPYEACAGNPVLTATDLGKASPLQAFGHADLVDTPSNTWFAVFLARRMLAGGTLCPLGRETFLCPVEWQTDGSAKFLREKSVKGSWRDRAGVRYSLMTHPEWNARLQKVKSHNETFSTGLAPGDAICIYRSTQGFYSRTNTTSRTIPASVSLSESGVRFTLDGVTESETLPLAPLCDQPRHNRFNGLAVGTFTPYPAQ